MRHTQLHSDWTRCVSKCFVCCATLSFRIEVFELLEVFDCKGIMSHAPRSAAFGSDLVFQHVSYFQFLEVFDCKGLMSRVSRSVAFGLRQMSIGGVLKKQKKRLAFSTKSVSSFFYK